MSDLRQLITQAENTYFEPELFRLNINNAIQTARTVTFLIQKDKDSIPSFDIWYEQNVLKDIQDDRIMTWLKDARNSIEKEGDLDVNSYWQACHLYSYTQKGLEVKSVSKVDLFLKISQLKKIFAKKYSQSDCLKAFTKNLH
ncbi:hypothetical protein [Chromobacterium violaceum]|uniref:hypothetical protein n=1 Tax=Chromobacterium violaceum TaxID=536 RepID=UPI003DA7F5F7